MQTERAYEQRQQDFDRTRPGIANASRYVGAHDALGLMMGGNSERAQHPQQQQRHDTVARHDAPPSTTGHPAPEAHPVAQAGADQPHHHTVRSGESYWSIAAQAGGTRSQINARTEQLRIANHDRALLPGLDIIGT
ncbi:MAG: LysM peptidoglycan-binding domain-containing protein [Candidatus Melainabacteria bacterium]|nr:LysM peptidoglycan-binding domain-containing protein [Candidatus Melainabacteria bacterium]